ncbi:gamma-glutamyltransferase family protein [Parvibium lacunae]|uniref:Gamma-glutamyltransferase family protein n=1 Tax=Parvibium lacunae TaxID=1888893 RepID=A0A368L4B3_9BURK|nr:gamma-glutamyltransferase family protein [Parvibium lacunae]RCS58421.1 gamma-glutamyltransferase family protein [Parvibium lacunae]
MRFDWHFPYPTARTPIFAPNVVATSQPLAAQAGLRMLQQGGNAIDAAIAAAAAITITEPVSNGLGSDLFAIVWDGQTLQGLNASGTAPAAWHLNYFERKYSLDPARKPIRGWDTVTVPGMVAGWMALHGRYGSLPLDTLLQPAVELAERGYAVSPNVQYKWAGQVPLLQDQPGFAQTFMPHGRAPEVGELFAMPDAGRTLRLIAQTQGRAFYEGEIAEKLVAHAQAHGAALSVDDLRQYQPEWVTPISQNYRGYTVHEIPPNGQGIAALIALGILNHVDLRQYAPDSVACQHLQIEAMKLAFEDVYHYVAAPEAMRITPQQLLDPSYLAERAKLLDVNRAQNYRPGLPPQGGTIYLTTADEQGRMVSLIQSNYMGFGSGVVVPGTGVSLQNRGHAFSFDAASPNVVAPGKRPFHTIIPGFLTQNGAPVMSFGVMGANMQPQGHVQTLVRMLDYGQNPQAACDAPRWKVNCGVWQKDSPNALLELENTMSAELVAGLKARGHQVVDVVDPYMDFGSGQFIWKTPAGYVAASDSRRDGQAVGF